MKENVKLLGNPTDGCLGASRTRMHLFVVKLTQRVSPTSLTTLLLKGQCVVCKASSLALVVLIEETSKKMFVAYTNTVAQFWSILHDQVVKSLLCYSYIGKLHRAKPLLYLSLKIRSLGCCTQYYIECATITWRNWFRVVTLHECSLAASSNCKKKIIWAVHIHSPGCQKIQRFSDACHNTNVLTAACGYH